MGAFESDPSCSRCGKPYTRRAGKIVVHVVKDSITGKPSKMCGDCLLDPERLSQQSFFSLGAFINVKQAMMSNVSPRVTAHELTEQFIAALEKGLVVSIENEQRV